MKSAIEMMKDDARECNRRAQTKWPGSFNMLGRAEMSAGRKRLAVRLREQGKSLAEIADRLDISRAAVSKMLSRARGND